jgi:hypothetical protein
MIIDAVAWSTFAFSYHLKRRELTAVYIRSHLISIVLTIALVGLFVCCSAVLYGKAGTLLFFKENINNIPGLCVVSLAATAQFYGLWYFAKQINRKHQGR